MSGARTEKPTPRRLREARRRGEVARSRELSGTAALLAGLAALAAAGGATLGLLAPFLRRSLERAVNAGAPPLGAVEEGLGLLARIALPIAAVALAGGALAAFGQVGPLFSLETVKPKLERLSPLRGLRRLFSWSQLAGVALGLAKAALVLLLAWKKVSAAAPALAGLARLEPGHCLAVAGPFALSLALEIAAVLVGFGLLDYALNRLRLSRSLRMTREEVRREQKDDEGDPHQKADRRRMHRALAEAGTVAGATCVVVNPTHLAVALHHRRDQEEAPKVLAKGMGRQARKLRSAAFRAGVPVVRDVALARALYRLAEVGEEIPEELYDAAALLLAHIYGLAHDEEGRLP